MKKTIKGKVTILHVSETGPNKIEHGTIIWRESTAADKARLKRAKRDYAKRMAAARKAA